MRRVATLFVTLTVAAAIPGLPARASHDEGVLVFAGTMAVGSSAWIDDNGLAAPGNGLCFPGRRADSTGTCVGDRQNPVGPDNGWSLQAPVACGAAGTFGGFTEAYAGARCTLNVNGLLSRAGSVGPSCGAWSGSTTAANPSLDGSNRDTATIGALVVEIEWEWVPTAGAIGLVSGRYIGPGGHVERFRGYVHSRPPSLADGAQDGNCLSIAAVKFRVAGMLVTDRGDAVA